MCTGVIGLSLPRRSSSLSSSSVSGVSHHDVCTYTYNILIFGRVVLCCAWLDRSSHRARVRSLLFGGVDQSSRNALCVSSIAVFVVFGVVFRFRSSVPIKSVSAPVFTKNESCQVLCVCCPHPCAPFSPTPPSTSLLPVDPSIDRVCSAQCSVFSVRDSV